jgi:Tol biopolymer transport system component
MAPVTAASTNERRLSSWKEIGSYLGCDARTAQRWEKTEELPVHRHRHNSLSSVYAFPSELDQWRANRAPARQTSTPIVAPPQTAAERKIPFFKKLPRTAVIVGGGLILAAAAAALWWPARTGNYPARTPIPQPLTSWFGVQTAATFSPDGTQLAFTWDGERHDNEDVYVMTVGSSHPLRLTTNALSDYSPAWSPDGRWIAFLRAQPDGTEALILKPPLDGPERVLTRRRPQISHIRDLDWSPDGRWLATGGLAVISAESGASLPLTHPPSGQTDISPAFSPDGHMIVFVRDHGEAVTGLGLLQLTNDVKAAGEAHMLSLPGFEKSLNSSPRWTPDGRDIIFVSNRGGMNRLWRVPAKGGTPLLLAGLGERLTLPALSRRGSRLAYCRRSYDTNIWRIAVPAEGDKRPVEPERFIASTWTEDSPQYAPDGKRIAFSSTRSGYDEIWICDREGSNPAQLTDLKANTTGSPRWSPDGRFLAFDSRAVGQPEIYVMPAEGGAMRQLTNHPAADILPVWSLDGKWIYFASDRGGSMQIWKMPAAGGEARQVTTHGGFACAFSPDGKWMYYTKQSQFSQLWRMPANGGDSVLIHESICDRCFAPAPGGVFLVESRKGEASSSLLFYPSSGQPAWIARITRRLIPGLTSSPDGRQVLFAEVDQDTGNLMLVENFQ